MLEEDTGVWFILAFSLCGRLRHGRRSAFGAPHRNIGAVIRADLIAILGAPLRITNALTLVATLHLLRSQSFLCAGGRRARNCWGRKIGFERRRHDAQSQRENTSRDEALDRGI